MKRLLSFFALAVAFAAPAHATAGLMCETTSGPSRTFVFGAGHHGAALWWGHEIVDGELVEIEIGQQWTDDERLFMDIVDTEKLEPRARIMATRQDDWSWVGTFTSDAGEQAIRCEES